MSVLCIVLVVLCLWLLAWNWNQRRSLRAAAQQLRWIERERSGGRLRLRAPNAPAEELLDAVNRLLEVRTAERAEGLEREHDLRRQIANVSHDLRTPLTSILGYLQLLEEADLTPEERQEYLAVVKNRAKALQSLITSFYDLSRLEGGEFAIQWEAVDLSASLSGLLASFYNDFTDAGFDVTVDFQEGLPPVQADPAGVLRVFTNLIRNALDHGQGRMEVRLFLEEGRVCTLFRNGAGELSPDDLPHVFDRFFTADKMRTGRNTGLGLAIVKALSERMGCTVRAELSEGMFAVRIFWKNSAYSVGPKP